MYPGRSLDIFFPDSYVSNKQLMKMWKRKLHIWPAARPLGRLNKWLPGSDKHEVPWRTDYAREIDIHGVLAATQVHVGFTDNEEQQGRVQRRAIGIPDGGPFVCFHARDSAYLDALSGTDTGKHDCRDSNIQTYIPAMEELVRRGYSAVRMGSVIKHPLTTMNPKIIDYATKGTTEFFDVYVSANCSFFVCSPTGFSRLPMIFRRPSAFVNFVPFEFVLAWGPNDLCIPKKLWLREEFRFMTLQEIFETGVAKFELSFLFDQRGIDVVENTSEEITALMVEMDERISGRWKTSEEDEDLQKRFRSYFEAYNPTRTYQSRVGAQFLRQNQDLLE
jgi:putative glycosyltransferase (TIGR04372 family)